MLEFYVYRCLMGFHPPAIQWCLHARGGGWQVSLLNSLALSLNHTGHSDHFCWTKTSFHLGIRRPLHSSFHKSKLMKIDKCFFIQFLIIKSQQNFAHVMTAWLSWHVQNFVVIKWLLVGLEPNNISTEFELWEKIVSEMGHSSTTQLPALMIVLWPLTSFIWYDSSWIFQEVKFTLLSLILH